MSETIQKQARCLTIMERERLLEKRIEEMFRVSVKRDDLMYNRNDDWGKRGFSLNIFFDEFGITTFKKYVEEILGMITEYQTLRADENVLQREITTQRSVDDQNKTSVMEHVSN